MTPQATKHLPEGYTQQAKLGMDGNTWVMIGINLLSIPLLFLFGWLFIAYATAVRPSSSLAFYNLVWQFQGSGSIAPLLGVLLALALMVIVHEAAHGLFFWLFTRERPVFGMRWFAAFAGAPDWYIKRDPYLIVGLAPFVLISGLGLLLIAFGPATWALWVLLVVIINAASSAGDFAVTAWLLFQSRETLVNDTGLSFTTYLQNPEGQPTTSSAAPPID
ncbi:MAG: DUF3267 domain-containing protein [Chloroflexi bacterium]|nr:DUF3267 domain-containing protein [Chloroflexota bacterium]